MALLWYFKETGHSPLMVALIFSIEAGIDIISFGFGPLIKRLSVVITVLVGADKK